MPRRKPTFADATMLDLLRLPLAGVAMYLALERMWWFARGPHPIVYLVSGALCVVAALVLVLQFLQHQADLPQDGHRMQMLAMPALMMVLPLGICGAITAGDGAFSRLDMGVLALTTIPVLLGVAGVVLFEPEPVRVVDGTGAVHWTADLSQAGSAILVAEIALGGGYTVWKMRRDGGLLVRSSRQVLRVAGLVTVAAAINDLLLWRGYLATVNLFDFAMAFLTLAFSWTYYKRSTLEIRDLESQRRSREVFLARSVGAQEAERARIARELHDATGQKLASLNMRLRALEREIPAAVAPKITELRALARETADELRRISRGLHPSILDDLGLAAALRACAEEIEAAHDLPVDLLALDRAGVRLDSEVELAIYRITQEALSNAARHADAERASVVLEWHADRVRLIVEDDGVGMNGELSSGLGLQSMRDRAEFLGGELSVEATDAGTTVCATIPLSGRLEGPAKKKPAGEDQGGEPGSPPRRTR